MGGSIFGRNLKVSTWGESHGKAVGAVVDGIPAGLKLCEADIQAYLDRRKPGQSRFTTARSESDTVQILSGVFEGVTTGTPISLMVANKDQRSRDYSNIKDVLRPGHADRTFLAKYGIRDYRGGGRSSGRETIGRVAAGAIAAKMLNELGITVSAYTRSIGPHEITHVDFDEMNNKLYMPDEKTAAEAAIYLEEAMKEGDSVGGVVECIIKNAPAGLGDPVFDKLDASLAYAMLSIGAVKGFEIGEGFKAALMKGSENNDAFCKGEEGIQKRTNHSGGVLGGMSDGSDIVFRAAFKPTPSISIQQDTVTTGGEDTQIVIAGRHDPVIVPRAVVVVETMAALVVADAVLSNASCQMEYLKCMN